MKNRGKAGVYAAEQFHILPSGDVARRVELSGGGVHETVLPAAGRRSADAAAMYDLAWIRSARRPESQSTSAAVRFVDLFAGCGAMSLGVAEACRAVGKPPEPVFALDVDEVALNTYAKNFPGSITIPTPIHEYLDGELGTPLTPREKKLRALIGPIDLLVGGPPCQGHSDLNNHTRRDDPKNLLYLRMARAAEVLNPTHVFVENVSAVVHDRRRVAQRTQSHLEQLGYFCHAGVLKAEQLGVPQNRRRFFLVASRQRHLNLGRLIATHRRSPRTVGWAIADLETAEGSSTFDTSANHSATNVRRIEYLFHHGLHELPDSERPPCHRKGGHSYRGVYGRMRWDEPAPTITTGFGSTGQGRFVHPRKPRTLTPHEAARVQGIPDFFEFADDRRTRLQHMIGNAVPPKLSYLIALELLR